MLNEKFLSYLVLHSFLDSGNNFIWRIVLPLNWDRMENLMYPDLNDKKKCFYCQNNKGNGN